MLLPKATLSKTSYKLPIARLVFYSVLLAIVWIFGEYFLPDKIARVPIYPRAVLSCLIAVGIVRAVYDLRYIRNFRQMNKEPYSLAARTELVEINSDETIWTMIEKGCEQLCEDIFG